MRQERQEKLKEVFREFLALYESGATPTDYRPTFDEIFEDVLSFVREDLGVTSFSMALGVSPENQVQELQKEKEALRVIFLEDLACEVKRKVDELGGLLQSYVRSTWPLSLLLRGWMYLVDLDLEDVYAFVNRAIEDAKAAGHTEDEFKLVKEVLERAEETERNYDLAVGAG